MRLRRPLPAVQGDTLHIVGVGDNRIGKLHSTNSYVVVLDRDDRVAFQRRLANDLEVVIAVLARFGSDIAGVVVESTYNWYWLVDGLEEAGYRVHLANTWAIKQYDGLKYGDDRTSNTTRHGWRAPCGSGCCRKATSIPRSSARSEI